MSLPPKLVHAWAFYFGLSATCWCRKKKKKEAKNYKQGKKNLRKKREFRWGNVCYFIKSSKLYHKKKTYK